MSVDMRVTSVGPRASKDVESSVLPDPEFYDVGRSVSGWYNFGGIRSIRKFVSTRFQSTPKGALPTLNEGRRYMPSQATDSTISGYKEATFAMVSTGERPNQRGYKTSLGGAPEPRSRKRKFFFLLGGLLAIAAAAAAVVLISSNSEQKKTGSLPDPREIASPAPTPSPVPGNITTPAPTGTGTLPLGTNAPTSTGATLSPTFVIDEETLKVNSHLTYRTYVSEADCVFIFCSGLVRYQFDQQIIASHEKRGDLRLDKFRAAVTLDGTNIGEIRANTPLEIKKNTEFRAEFLTVYMGSATRTLLFDSLASCTEAALHPWKVTLTMSEVGKTEDITLNIRFPCGVVPESD